MTTPTIPVTVLTITHFHKSGITVHATPDAARDFLYDYISERTIDGDLPSGPDAAIAAYFGDTSDTQYRITEATLGAPLAQGVTVLAVDHKHGVNFSAHTTDEDAKDSLHAYVIAAWPDHGEGAMPDDRDKAIEAYFHENEADESWVMEGIPLSGPRTSAPADSPATPADDPQGIPAAVRDWIITTHGGHAAQAILALSTDYGVAVAYQSRDSLEGGLGRPFTPAEWDRVKPELDGYDEWLDNSGALDSIDTWRDQLMETATVPAECAECGNPMFLDANEVAHHYDGKADLPLFGSAGWDLPVDHDTDADHVAIGEYVSVTG